MPAPATVLAFTGQPSVTIQDSAMKPVQVTAYDSLGNKATNFVGSIQLRIGTDGSISKKAALAGGVASAVAGVATFPNLRIDSVGAGYTLTAAFGSAAPVDTSLPFNITQGPPPPPPPPTHLGFTQQPQRTDVGATITPPVQVAALDASEHVVQGFTGAIGLALQPASNGGTLSGGTPINAVNGIATFPSLSVDKAGNGYTLRATASGLTDATSNTFNVTPPPNQSPVAAFTASCPTLTCSFTDQSSDPDGTVTSWQWTFGDGTTGSTAQNPSHTYSAAGSYTVTLTVKDNQNASSSPVSHTVQVTAPNQPPSAAFTSSCNGLACSFSDQSSDPDGSVASWQWTFGDGTTGSTAQNPSHTYSAAGSYTVTLTVKDNQNASSSPVSHTVQVTAPNQPPSAAFTSSCNGLACSFSDQSSDPDGSVTSWQWTFGDGTTGSTAQNPSHTYSASGSYTVTLTVTDNQGAQNSVTHPVTPSQPNVAPVVNAGSDDHALTGLLYSFTWSFSDGNHNGPWSYTIDWGDGSTSSGNVSNEGSFSAGHTYIIVLPRSFTITVTVRDASGASGSDLKAVSVTLL